MRQTRPRLIQRLRIASAQWIGPFMPWRRELAAQRRKQGEIFEPEPVVSGELNIGHPLFGIGAALKIPMRLLESQRMIPLVACSFSQRRTNPLTFDQRIKIDQTGIASVGGGRLIGRTPSV